MVGSRCRSEVRACAAEADLPCLGLTACIERPGPCGDSPDIDRDIDMDLGLWGDFGDRSSLSRSKGLPTEVEMGGILTVRPAIAPSPFTGDIGAWLDINEAAAESESILEGQTAL
jgi:hypothetical protein